MARKVQLVRVDARTRHFVPSASLIEARDVAANNFLALGIDAEAVQGLTVVGAHRASSVAVTRLHHSRSVLVERLNANTGTPRADTGSGGRTQR